MMGALGRWGSVEASALRREDEPAVQIRVADSATQPRREPPIEADGPVEADAALGASSGGDSPTDRRAFEITRETLDAQRSSRRFAREEARTALYRTARRTAVRKVTVDGVWVASALVLTAVLVVTAIRIGAEAISAGGAFTLANAASALAPSAWVLAGLTVGGVIGLGFAALLTRREIFGLGGVRPAEVDFRREARRFSDQTRGHGRMLSDALKEEIDAAAQTGSFSSADGERLSMLWLAYKDYFDVADSMKLSLEPGHVERRSTPEITFGVGAFAFGLIVGVLGSVVFLDASALTGETAPLVIAGLFGALLGSQALVAVVKSAHRGAFRKLEDVYRGQFASMQLEGPSRLSKEIEARLRESA